MSLHILLWRAYNTASVCTCTHTYGRQESNHEIDQFSWNGYKSNNNDNKMKHQHHTHASRAHHSLRCKYIVSQPNSNWKFRIFAEIIEGLCANDWHQEINIGSVGAVLLCFAGSYGPYSDVWCIFRMRSSNAVRSTSISDKIERNTNVAY